MSSKDDWLDVGPSMKLLVLVGVLMLWFATTSAASAITCQFESGEQRWNIKTSLRSGPDAHVRAVALRSLIALPNPDVDAASIETSRWTGSVSAQDDAGHALTLHEGDLVTVTGYLYRARCRTDGDYHMEIGVSPARRNARCLIVEVPDPSQIPDHQLRTLIRRARDDLESMGSSVFASHARARPLQVTVTGQLFLDESHHRSADPSGGRGTLLDSGRHCASNLWEVHPVFRIE